MMDARSRLAMVFVMACVSAAGPGAQPQSQARHPTELPFPPFTYTPPRAEAFRLALPNGAVAYVASDRQFPLVAIRATVRAGGLYDPDDKVGLSQWVARGLSDASTPAIPLEQKRAVLADGGEFNVASDAVSITLTLSTASERARDAIRFVAGLLRAPVFGEATLERERKFAGITAAGWRTPEAEVRSWFDRLLYGNHRLVRPPTPGLLARLTVADLEAFHASFFRPSNVVVTVAGDVDAADVRKWLADDLSSWVTAPPQFPPEGDSIATAARKIYMIHRAGTDQAFNQLGHATLRMDHPDYFTLQVVNWLLTGGKVYEGYGAFSARLWFELRTKRAISSMGYSEASDPVFYPSAFILYWKGREERAGEALSVVLKELERLRQEPVSPLELDTARNFYRYGLPSRFHSAEATVRTFAELEFQRAPLDYYLRFQQALERVTASDVQRVARDHLHPDRFLIVMLGDAAAIQKHARDGGIALSDLAPVEVIGERGAQR